MYLSRGSMVGCEKGGMETGARGKGAWHMLSGIWRKVMPYGKSARNLPPLMISLIPGR